MEITVSAIATVGMVVAVVAALPATGFVAAGAVDSTAGMGIAASGPGVGLFGSAAATGPENGTNSSENASNGSIAPGAMLSGVVGVQKAEIQGEVEERAFGIRIANASSNESKASVVAEQLETIRDRLAELRAEKKELREARNNGSISEDQYKAQLAALNTKVQSVKRLTNQTANATKGLPDELLREKGINASAIRTLKQNASDLAGPEVAKIARQIAGPDAGKSLGRGNGPGDAGPPGRNGTGAGPPTGNDSNGSPPADPGNKTGGNENRSNAGGPDDGSAPADGGQDNGSAPADGGQDNGSAPADSENGSTSGGDGDADSDSDSASASRDSADTTPIAARSRL